ncbi:MAG TPA: amidase [Burkholderiales bacterium]|jgi:amidase|nr:amidase [Burkholderiales bacterium]
MNGFSTVAELAAALRQRRVKARELLERVIARIATDNARLNAVVTFDYEGARGSADRADAARARGEALPPLSGVPVTIKDSLETAGMRTTCGAAQWSRYVPERNAAAVQMLIGAGCIVLGKSNTPIYTGDLQTYNTLFGVTRNPWDRTRSCGGSSGGSAVSVACGFSAFELGSDIGGSIRIPAHCCGVYGHKPTYGLIPFQGHIPPPPGNVAAPDLAVVGPIARHADDLETVLLAAARPAAALKEACVRRLQNYRAAVWIDDGDFPIDGAVKELLENCLDALGRAGVSIRRARPVPRLGALFDDYLRLLWPVTTAHLSQKAMARVIETGAASPPESWHAKLARYANAAHRDWLAVHERREQLRARLRDFFREFDVLLMPTSPVAAIPHDHSEDLMARTIRINGEARWYWEQLAWIALATMAYLPATVAPVGLTRNGLPVGLQIVGPEFGDRVTIHFARCMAAAVGGFVPPPGYEDRA